jgi:hypothetical protein
VTSVISHEFTGCAPDKQTTRRRTFSCLRDEIPGQPHIETIRMALEVLHDQLGGRAERIQQIFSPSGYNLCQAPGFP